MKNSRQVAAADFFTIVSLRWVGLGLGFFCAGHEEL